MVDICPDRTPESDIRQKSRDGAERNCAGIVSRWNFPRLVEANSEDGPSRSFVICCRNRAAAESAEDASVAKQMFKQGRMPNQEIKLQ